MRERIVMLIIVLISQIYIVHAVDWDKIEKGKIDLKLFNEAFMEDKEKTLTIVEKFFNSLKPELKEEIIKKIDTSLENFSILNKYPTLKREWFLYYGIIDEGCEIVMYDKEEKRVALKSELKFTLPENEGSILTNYNSIILKNEAEIFTGSMKKIVEEGKEKISIYIPLERREEKVADITKSKEINLLVICKNCLIKDENRRFFGSKYEIKKEEDKLTVEGKELEIIGKEYMEVVDGIVSFEKERKIIKEGSYTKYKYFDITWKPIISYDVKVETFIFDKQGRCEKVEVSCIEETENINVKAKGDNKIIIETFPDSSYKSIFVDFIKDKSEVNFIDKGAIEIKFPKFSIEGYLNHISVDVTYRFYDRNEPHEILIKDKKLYYCSICNEKGNIRTIDLTKIQSRETRLFSNVYKWAKEAANNPENAAMGGGKGKIIYPDIYKIYEKDKKHTIEEYKKFYIEEYESQKKKYSEIKKSLEKEIETLEKLKEEVSEERRREILEQIENKRLNSEEIEEYLKGIEKKIEKIKTVKHGYDCIGFVQAALENGEEISGLSRTNWLQKTDGIQVINELSRKYKIKKVLVILGEKISESEYKYGESIKIIPKVDKDTEILFFNDKKERDKFLRLVSPGSPFQNFNSKGHPSHSGIKGMSEYSLEAHIGSEEISDEDLITRYLDPLLFGMLPRQKITLRDLLKVEIAKK